MGGTNTVIAACRARGVRKLVMSSSPSTRMGTADIDGLSESALPSLPRPKSEYNDVYSRTKADSELALRAANGPDLLTMCVSPHQVGRYS